MDENQKINLKFFICLLEKNKMVGPLLRNSAKKILNTSENQLDDISCLQCLQEISSLIQYKSEIKDYIEKVVNDWNNPSSLLCIPAKFQYYFCLGQDVAFAYQESAEIINEIRSFVKTQHIDGRKVCDEVYENFLDMLDSLSVCPKKDFMKAWSKILHYYNQIPPVVSSDLNETGPSPTFLTLLSCFKHIKNFENGSF